MCLNIALVHETFHGPMYYVQCTALCTVLYNTVWLWKNYCCVWI